MTDKQFYLQIWEERDHVSEVSGKALGEEPNYTYFAHILGKGSYPRFRHNPNNVMLMTFEEHYEFDHNTHKAKNNPMFDKVFEKQRQLKIEYNRNSTEKF